MEWSPRGDAWGSKWTININTEMNHWLAGPGNLAECYAPLLSLLPNAAIGGAWLCKSVWDYYELTGDIEVIAKNYDVLKGCAQFYIETLVQHPKLGYLVTNPSVSPENAHHPDVSICAGPSMDMSILPDLFANVAEAARLLDVDEPFRDLLLTKRAELTPLAIGGQGQLQEWIVDWDLIVPEQNHRHVSHLYALHPSNQITPQRTPDLADACRTTLFARGDESTGWRVKTPTPGCEFWTTRWTKSTLALDRADILHWYQATPSAPHLFYGLTSRLALGGRVNCASHSTGREHKRRKGCPFTNVNGQP